MVLLTLRRLLLKLKLRWIVDLRQPCPYAECAKPILVEFNSKGTGICPECAQVIVAGRRGFVAALRLTVERPGVSTGLVANLFLVVSLGAHPVAWTVCGWGICWWVWFCGKDNVGPGRFILGVIAWAASYDLLATALNEALIQILSR